MLSLFVLLALALIAAGAAAWFWRRNEIETWRGRLWDFIVRWRLQVAGVAAILVTDLPDLLYAIFRDPEFLALVPEVWKEPINTVTIIALLLIRIRPASRTKDAEVQAKIAADSAAKATGEPVAMLIMPAGDRAVTVATMQPKGVKP